MAKKLTRDEKIALHTQMCEGYYDDYHNYGLESGKKYKAWDFAENATYHSPYFTGGIVMPLQDFSPERHVDISVFSTMEARQFRVKLPDWGIDKFRYWASENGMVQQVHWVGHTPAGKEYAFWSITFCETNDYGEITKWETFVDEKEIAPSYQLICNNPGPFKSPVAYFEALMAVGQKPEIYKEDEKKAQEAKEKKKK